MQASGNLVDVDILELSRFSCGGVDILCTSIGLVLMMMKKIDLKLTQGMVERLSLHRMRNHGEGVSGSNPGQTQRVLIPFYKKNSLKLDEQDELRYILSLLMKLLYQIG